LHLPLATNDSLLPQLLRLAPVAAQAFLMDRVQRKQFSVGSSIAEFAEPCRSLWFVERGLIDVQFPHPRGTEKLPGPILQAGDLYGSQADDENAVHGVWLTALTDCEIVEISADTLRDGLVKFPELQKLHKLVWRDRAVSSFAARLAELVPGDESTVLELLTQMEPATFAKGDTLLLAGASVNDLSLIQIGTVVSKHAEESNGRNSQPVQLGPGSVVSLPALLLKLRSSDNFMAVDEVQVLKLSGEQLRQLFSAQPSLHQAFGELVSRGMDVRSPTNACPNLDRPQQIEIKAASAAALDGPVEQPDWWDRMPLIRQREEMDCGAACLRIIHAHHGHDLDYRTSRTIAKVSRYGTSLMDLAEAAERLGYLATGVEIKDWDTLGSINLPAIAHVDKNHFVVLWRVGRNWVQLSDPGAGKVRQSKAEFEKRYGGFLLIMRPTDALAKVAAEQKLAPAEPAKPKFSAWRLWPFLRPFRGLMAHILFASVLLQAFGLVTPLLTQVMIDRVIGYGEAGLLNVIFIALIGLTVCQALVGLSRSLLMLHVSLQLERNVMEAVYRRVVSLAHSFFSKFTTGDLVRRFDEVNSINNFLSENAIAVLLDLLSMFAYAALMLWLQPQLAILFLLLSLMSGAVVVMLARPVKRYTQDFLVKFGQLQTHIINTFKGIEPIKAMSLEVPFGNWFGTLLVPALTFSRKAAKWSIAAAITLQLVDGITLAILLWRGSYLILGGLLSLGQLVAFLMLAQMATGPFLRLLQQWSEFQRTVVSLERVGDLLDETPEAELQEQRGAGFGLPNFRGAIHFANVSFRYDGDPKDASRNVIDSFELSISPGEVVGIVGRSGCGKSTLARLLLRFHEPTTGRILLDGFHLRDLNAQMLRRQIGLVTQHAFLYSSSIRDNILCGRERVTEEDLILATTAAGAYEFISRLPYGFETKVGEHGLQLSGGQAQRIVIARALCTNPRMLIFDEATAALDPLVERDIHEGLREVIRGRTTLIIAHRLHTLRRADRIVVLDQGRLVEQGSHDKLMARQGLYWQMFTASPDWQMASALQNAPSKLLAEEA
jgi:ATP-binding cassette, subfamily B, bacterial HlyB/CyaB